MMVRRRILAALAAACASASFPLPAQQAGRVRRIGLLIGANPTFTEGWLAAFRQGMAELRWVEGRDYRIESRYANGVAQALPGLAAELVATEPDVLLTAGDAAILPLARRTKTIPIVFALANDPLAGGFVTNLRRPGGNVTGLTNLAIDVAAKRVQLLKEAFPRLAHVGVLFASDDLGLPQVKVIQESAPRLGVRVVPIEVPQIAEIEPAVKRGAAAGAQAYIVVTGPLFNARSRVVLEAISRSGLPAIYGSEPFVEDGGLMSYATSTRDNFRRAAGYVDKILRGARPGELPIEQPVKFELVVNQKSARAMGISFPSSFLLRVDRVIE